MKCNIYSNIVGKEKKRKEKKKKKKLALLDRSVADYSIINVAVAVIITQLIRRRGWCWLVDPCRIP